MNTIEKIEKDKWGTPPTHVSNLVKSCYELRRKDIKRLTNNELRIAISQEIGLKIVIPIIIKKLQIDPFLDSMYYPGDLLFNLLDVEKDFWEKNKDLQKKVHDINIEVLHTISNSTLNQEVQNELKLKIDKWQHNFRDKSE